MYLRTGFMTAPTQALAPAALGQFTDSTLLTQTGASVTSTCHCRSCELQHTPIVRTFAWVNGPRHHALHFMPSCAYPRTRLNISRY